MLKAIIALLLSISTQTAMATPDQAFILDFMTQRAAITKHGTLSLIDGALMTTWTVEQSGNKRTFDISISEDKFRKLWDALSETPEIENFRVKSPNEYIDFTNNYVIGVIFTLSGRQGQAMYLIPHTASGPAAKWAREIEGIAGK